MTPHQQSPSPTPTPIPSPPKTTKTNKKQETTKRVVTKQKQWFLILFLVLSLLSTMVYNIGTSPQMKQWLRYTRNDVDDGVPHTKHGRRPPWRLWNLKESYTHDDTTTTIRQKSPQRQKYRTTQEIVASMMATQNSFQSSTDTTSTGSTTTTPPWSWTKATPTTMTATNSTLSSTSFTTTTKKGWKLQLFDQRLLNVGQVGEAVARAKKLGFVNRMKGFSHSRTWNIIGTDLCLDQGEPDYLNDTTTNATSSRQNQNHHHLHLPHAILLGVQKGGTTALYSYLDRHPNIIHSKKELYFLDETVDRLLLRRQSLGQPEGIPRRESRSAYSIILKKAMITKSQKQDVVGVSGKDDKSNKKNRKGRPARNIKNDTTIYVDDNDDDDDNSNNNNTGMIRLDLTPHYIYLSDRVPQRIMCIVPWVKLFALLRNPVDRAFSNYNMKFAIFTSQQKKRQQQQQRRPPPKPRRQLKQRILPFRSAVERRDGGGRGGGGVVTAPTFDEYVRMDIAALYETGVLQDWNTVDFQSFSGSEQEFRAWQAYINSGLNAPVGMGLYSIMLKHLFRQFELHGKSIANDFLAIPSEQLQHDTDATYGRVLDFLGVPRISLDAYPAQNSAASKLKPTNLPPKMSPETEQLLKDVFEPYNRELASLLGSEWENIWST
jgi:hypothetical protein